MRSNHPLVGNALWGARPVPMSVPAPGRGLYIVDNPLKLLKTLHLLAAICWVGGAFSLMVLAGLRTVHREESHMASLINECIHYVDVGVVVPGVIGCIVTGFIYSVCINFGFTKFFWIFYKWVICLNAFFWGTTFLGPWSDTLFALSVQWGFYDSLNFVHDCVMPQTSWGGVAQFLLLLSMVAISVYRPTSWTNWYEGQSQQPAGVRHGVAPAPPAASTSMEDSHER